MPNRSIPKIPLFAPIPEHEIELLISRFRLIDLPSDVLVFSEGDCGDCFYIILDGELEIIKALNTGAERLLGVRTSGDCVGEMSLLHPNGLRSASVRSHSAVKLLEITREDFDALLHRWPAIAYEMARMLSTCLRDSNNATIRDLQNINRQLAKAYYELKAAHTQIIEKERLERELQVAREIQQRILPRSGPVLDGFDFGFRMEPARAVGGDFFDFIPFNKDVLAICVGDVSDKGTPAALFMAMTRSLVRAEARRSASPREAMENVNRHLLDMNDAAMFATMIYGVLDRESRKFAYVRAGHEAPLLCDSSGSIARFPRGSGQALGVFPNPALDEQSVTLPPGSVLLMYTDGLTEARDARGEFFGAQKVCDMVRAHRHESGQKLCDRLVGALEKHQDSVPKHDDVTLVAIRSE